MKLRKIITMGLAAIMAVSAISISAYASETEAYTEENGIIYTGDKNDYEDVTNAIFITEDDEIKQITALNCDNKPEDLSVTIIDNNVIVSDSNGEVVQVSPLAFTPSDDTTSGSFIYTKYRVTGNNVPMWNWPGMNDLILTLEKGVSFWSNMSIGNIYRVGYVLSNGTQISGAVETKYLAAA